MKKPSENLQNIINRAYFSDYFEVAPETIEKYGAVNVCLVTDLPLFIDPFLLFNSKKKAYRDLHASIIKYIKFLKDKAVEGLVDDGLIKAWYMFPEVKQTWLGFSVESNKGSGLGYHFATALHQNLNNIFTDFGIEKVTKSSHLEKLCLIKEGVGKDNISDFTTNLIKQFLLEYTQAFAKKFIKQEFRNLVPVQKVNFNYKTESWETRVYDLPYFNNDYVLLTPKDILTRDDTWLNKEDFLDQFYLIPAAIRDEELRAQVNNYFIKMIPKKAKKKDVRIAASHTIARFPQTVDYYIKLKEEDGERATSISSEKVELSKRLFIDQFKQIIKQLGELTDFYKIPGNTHEEAHQRVAYLKDLIENKDCYRHFYLKGKSLEREEDLKILFRATWYGTPSDVNTEVNNGRGAADFIISRGAIDKSIVELKLAKNTQLKKNLKNQVPIYQKASNAKKSIKVIIYFSKEQLARVNNILNELDLVGNKDIVLIDARNDNKPSASKA